MVEIAVRWGRQLQRAEANIVPYTFPSLLPEPNQSAVYVPTSLPGLQIHATDSAARDRTVQNLKSSLTSKQVSCNQQQEG